MARDETQQAILRAEFLWFGGTLGPPKTYDAGTSHHTPPNLRVSDDRADTTFVDEQHPSEGSPSTPARLITFEESESGWTITFDGIE